jgi:hypothetical protein
VTARSIVPFSLADVLTGAAGATLLVVLLAGCGSATKGNPSAETSSIPQKTTSAGASAAGNPPFPTLTAPNLQPLKQQNQGRPDVAFDPCTWIDDDTLQKLGYAPASRRRHPTADIHAEYTFLSCQFESPDKVYGLSILSGNRTMDEGRAKFTLDRARIEDTSIDGRTAMIVRTYPGDTCDVLLQTKAGYIDFDRDIAGYLITNSPVPERCSGMVDLVQAIIPRIGNN